MKDTLLGEHIRRGNRNLLILNLFLVLGGMAVLLLSSGYLIDALRGPVAVTQADLARVKSARDLPSQYVTLTTDKALDTGLRDVMVRRRKYSNQEVSRTTDAFYLATRVGNRLLIIKSPTQATGTRFTGSLEEVPAELVSRLQVPSDVKIMPFLLNAEPYTGWAYGILAVAFPLVGIGFWNIARARTREADPAKHPSARQLEPHGDPHALALGMDQEFKTSHRRIGDLLFTTSWILKPSFFGLQVLSLGDVIWAYKKVTQHRTNFIPTHKTYAMVIRTRGGVSLEFDATEANTDALLGQIQHQTPWVIMGFDQELEQTWTRNRAAFVEEVDRRRAEVMRQYTEWQAQQQTQPHA